MNLSTISKSPFLRVGYIWRRSVYPSFVKRCLDLILCLLLAPIVVPILILIGIGMAFAGGPIFFGHKRVGRNGQTFKCWKLRTMAVDAESRLTTLLENDAEARREWKENRKLKADPRVTRLGAILRRTSLDELPQLWNVFRGDMSLVGPRPLTSEELAEFGPARNRYEAVLPGVTGLWQVSGRNDMALDERRFIESSYVDRMGLRHDLHMIFKTPWVMLRGTGY